MTRLLVEFADPESLKRGAIRLGTDGNGASVLDAYTPFSVGGLSDLLAPAPPSRVRLVILAGGAAGAALGLALQWYSAVIDLPIVSGGRPLADWPDFFFATFELGILGAALAGFAAFLVGCGLPRLDHPLFDVPGFERATQDRFFLEVAVAQDRIQALRHALEAEGALALRELGE